MIQYKLYKKIMLYRFGILAIKNPDRLIGVKKGIEKTFIKLGKSTESLMLQQGRKHQNLDELTKVVDSGEHLQLTLRVRQRQQRFSKSPG